MHYMLQIAFKRPDYISLTMSDGTPTKQARVTRGTIAAAIMNAAADAVLSATPTPPPIPSPAVIDAAVLAAVKTAQDALAHAPLTTIIADLETEELACRPCCAYALFCCLRLRKRRVAQLLHVPPNDPAAAPAVDAIAGTGAAAALA